MAVRRRPEPSGYEMEAPQGLESPSAVISYWDYVRRACVERYGRDLTQPSAAQAR